MPRQNVESHARSRFAGRSIYHHATKQGDDFDQPKPKFERGIPCTALVLLKKSWMKTIPPLEEPWYKNYFEKKIIFTDFRKNLCWRFKLTSSMLEPKDFKVISPAKFEIFLTTMVGSLFPSSIHQGYIYSLSHKIFPSS